MRIESSVTAISWIPSEAVKGLPKMPFEASMAHYDQAPPEHIDDIEALQREGRFRFANELRAWVEVDDDGRIVKVGNEGRTHICHTDMGLGKRTLRSFPPVVFPTIEPEPDWSATSATFIRTAGGATGAPAPRRVNRKPFIKWQAPTAWTTLKLTINADGTSTHEVLGASPFPRHWIFDHNGDVVAKSGLIDFETWWKDAFGDHTPWGDQDSPALITEVETALERELSATIMRGGEKPKIKNIKEGELLTKQGEEGKEMYLVLDGVIAVEVDGEPLAELGPGAVTGMRALIEGGKRTSTNRAVTRCKVAAVSGDQIDPAVLAELAETQKREDNR